MIGRDEPVRPFELIRWARDQARAHNLRPVEAHVLLVLATYANEEATAWPSLRTIATDCGLRPTAQGRCSSVSAAIRRLEDLRLVWTRQGGHGKPARRELLFNPVQRSAQTEPSADQGSVTQEPSAGQRSVEPEPTSSPAFRADGQQRSAHTEQNYQENGQLNGQEERPEEAFPQGGTLPIPRRGTLDSRGRKRKRGLRQPDLIAAIGGA